MLLLWISKIWLFYFLVLVLTLPSVSLVNSHITIPYSPSPCHLWFHRLPSHRSLSRSCISRSVSLPVLIEKLFPYSWSGCQAFSVCFIWSLYSIQDMGVIGISTAPHVTVVLYSFPNHFCQSIFLLIMAAHRTGIFTNWPAFCIFNCFLLLIASQSISLTVLHTDIHMSLSSYFFLTAL